VTARRAASLLLLAVVIGIGWGTLARSASGEAQAPADPKPGTAELRDRLVKGSPSDFGVTPDGSVWGVLMETGYPGAAVTLAALADGNASLYVSTGGGVIGGGEHEAVRAAAKRFVHQAGGFTAAMSAASSFPFPAEGRTRFYLLTTEGVVQVEAAEGDLGGGKHALSPLFYAGHEVITALREASEAKGR
jgi:hypothetical protein